MPKILYKYCDERGADIFRYCRLKITPPNQFNDPFEFAPRMKPSVPRRQARKAMKNKQTIKKLYETMKGDGSFTGNFRTFRHRVQSNDVQETLINKMIEDYPSQAVELRKHHVDMVSAEFGLLCLSSVFDDILMWSHYSRSHTGFVVGLKTSHPFFQLGPETLEVEYNEERVLMGHSVGLSDAEHSTSIRALVRRKSPHWQYEGEWRQLNSLSACTSGKGAAGKTLHYREADEALIAEVILGCRCGDALANNIGALLDKPVYSHVRVRRAAMHDDEFKLVFSDSHVRQPQAI